jgi:hypothetical protein
MHPRSTAGLMGLQPARRAETPGLTLDQTRKIKLRARCGQIIVAGFGKTQKTLSNKSTDCVRSSIISVSMTKTIAKIACDGMTTTFLKGLAENISLIHAYAFRNIKDAISAFCLCMLAIA